MLPAPSAADARTRDSFMALLQAMSRPGTEQSMGGLSQHETLILIGETLLDLETTFYSREANLTQVYQRFGAREVALTQADYVFWPRVAEGDLELLGTAPVGDMLYPDRGASLFLGCELDSGQSLSLTGPGIEDRISLTVNGIPGAFWTLRNRITEYPLGWDIYLVHQRGISGIPRSSELLIG